MNALVLDLNKAKETLVLDLQKVGVMKIPTMETRLAVDFSGSMSEEFSGGLVSHTIDLFLAAALTFDDNATLDMGFFNGTFREAPPAKVEDLGVYLQKNRIGYPNGGTNYAPIIEGFETSLPGTPKVSTGFLAKILGRDKEKERSSAYHRAYVGVVTDGDNNDGSEFEAALKATSGDTFFQFIAIGRQVSTSYLTRIAARYPHVSFVHIPDPHNISDDEFLELIANEKLATWINSWA